MTTEDSVNRKMDQLADELLKLRPIAQKHSKIEDSWHLSLMQGNILSIQLIADEAIKRDHLCKREIEVLIGLIKRNITDLDKHFNVLVERMGNSRG